MEDNEEAFKNEVHTWASKIGVKPVGIDFQQIDEKWGFCSPNKRLCFSYDLLHEERIFQTIVIVHELLHINVPNHGKLFKSLMSAYVPGWEKIANNRSCCYYN